LGSCDHADYAAGARVLAEFSRQDRVGFLDLPEVTRVGGAERFFEYWLRLNHFTPAALLAHHGSVFGYEGWQTVSVMTAMLAMLNVPLALIFFRAVFGLRGAGATAAAALYAVSPLCAYGVHHGAMAQFLAMQGIMLVTLAARGATWRWLPLAVAAVWLLAGSYNFILTVAFAPAAGWLLWRGVFRGQWRAAGLGAGLWAASMAICAVLFWGRFAGIMERFKLLDVHDFGWPVPLQGPVGWLGVVQGPGLCDYSASVAALSSAVLFALTGYWLWRERMRALAPMAVLAPVLIGYLMLVAKSDDSANASYNAYKFLAVFLPVLMGGCLVWLRLFPMDRRWAAFVPGAALTVLLAANLAAQADFRAAVARAPLVVTSELRALQQFEQEARITSINLRLEDFWARMWANTFLLRKPQYFVTHSYEARKDTALRGEWDLSDALLRVLPAGEADGVMVNDRFVATRVNTAPGSAGFGAGWHSAESDNRLARWRWTDGDGVIHLHGTQSQFWRCRLSLKLRSAVSDHVSIMHRGQPLATVSLSSDRIEPITLEFILPSGLSELRIVNHSSSAPGGSTDARLLGTALYQFELRALRPESR
jgi:hypothetical protein